MLETLESDEPTVFVSLPKNDTDLAEAAVAAGAQGLKVHINVNHRASGTTFGTLEEERATIENICDFDVPIGIVPGQNLEIIRGALPLLNELPIDFVDAYAHHLPATFESHTDYPTWASASDEYSFEEIRALNTATIDVVELGIQPKERYGEEVSTRDVATYIRLNNILEKPAVVPSQLKLTPSDTRRLSESGVSNFLLGAVVIGNTVDSVSETVSSFTS